MLSDMIAPHEGVRDGRVFMQQGGADVLAIAVYPEDAG